jgi:hypothetical protein
MLMAIVGAFMWFGYIRPALNKVSGPPIRVVDSAEMKALAGREIIAGEESELEGLNQDAPQEMTPEEKAAAEAEKLKQELESDETLPKDPVEREMELLRRLNQKYPQLISGIIRQWIND